MNGDRVVWEPTVAVRGTIVLIHGRGEHPGVYERFGTRMAFDGYRVVAPVVAPDLDIAAELGAYDDGPRILLGHDSGAVTGWEAAHNVQVDAVVLAGAAAEGGAELASTSTQVELDVRSACPVHRARLEADTRFAWAALDTRLLPLSAAAPTAPTLFVHGQVDAVASAEAVRRFAAARPTTRLELFEDGRHDILNDKMHRSVAATIVLFLEDVLKGNRRVGGGGNDADAAPVTSPKSLKSRRSAPVHVSARLDYTLKALTTLAEVTADSVKCEVLAHTWGIPLNSLVNIMGELRREGLVVSQRGCDGGYRLARPASEISVADVVRAVEGAVVTTSVHDAVQPLWSELEGRVTALFDTWTLDRLAAARITDTQTTDTQEAAVS